MVTNHGIHTWEVRSGLVDTGGQNQYVRSLSDTLVSLGYRVTTYNRGGFADPVTGEMQKGARYKDEHSRIVYLEGGPSGFVRKEDLTPEILEEEAKFAQRLISEEKLPLDLIISHYWDAAVLVNHLKKSAGLKAKHVWVPHSLGALKKDNFKNKPADVVAPLKFDERIAYERDLLKGVDAVASTSGDISAYLKDNYGREPELFLPPCIDTRITYPVDTNTDLSRIHEFLSKTDPKTGSRVKGMATVLEMSRTDRTKRKDIVVKAFAETLKVHPDTMLLLRISPQSKELYSELTSLVDSLGIRSNVVFVGMVPEDLMSELYALSTVYISPSEMEGFGMSVQEAASCKRATISSSLIPFATEYLAKNAATETITTKEGPVSIKWGEGAAVVPAGRTEGFAHALKTLLADRTKRDKMAQSAYDITIPYFTWENMTRRLLTSMDIGVPQAMNAQATEDRFRPWGFYEVLSDTNTHKVKRITVYPERRLSLQRHKRRQEHWYVASGEAVVTLDKKEIPLKAGEAVDIPKYTSHRMRNPGKTDLVFIEVQTGDYFGEDDIERLEDDFGRA